MLGDLTDGVPDGWPEIPSPAAVAAHLEALNLAGLAFATKRLLGKDPGPVSGQFMMWTRSGQLGLPALTDAFWRALAPLRTGRPSSTSAAVCDQVLVGREPDGSIGQAAVRDCAAAGRAQFKAAPFPESPDDSRAEMVRQRALVNAVKDYWRAMGVIYGVVRPKVVSGDLPGSVALLRKGEKRLRETVERVAVLASGVAGADVADIADVGPAPQPEPSEMHTAVEEVAPVEVEPPTQRSAIVTQAQAEAFARQQPLQPEVEEVFEPAPVEVLSTRPVRNHIFLPVVFLLVVSAIALLVLYTIVNDPTNPLAR